MSRVIKRLKLTLLALIIGCIPVLPAFNNSKVNALSSSDWVAGRIIDDSVFFNPHTMSADNIQTFLNSKVPTCTGSNPTCLKSFVVQEVPTIPADAYCGQINGGSNFNAATIIKIVTAACGMNPQAMLVLIQKEQGLVTSTAPTDRMYKFATGFCVYDTGPPPPSCAGTEGFFNQVYYAARQFQKYAKNPNNYNFAAGRASKVQYNPNVSCGSSDVMMQNQATAGLYNYTPYQPNQAALDAGWGEAPCGAYGNRNFWRYFWTWFGNPIGSEYAWLIDNFTYSSGDVIASKGYEETLTLKARNVGRQPWYNHGNHPVRLGTWEPANRSTSILPTRIATLLESVVQPNEIGTFQFRINPQNAGVFVESLNLVAENYAWMAWPGFRPTITVSDSPYQWRVDRVSYGAGTGVMDPGSTQSMTVFATNTGNSAWSKTSGPPVWLGTWPPGRASTVGVSPNSSKWPSPTRVTQMNDSTVAAGGPLGSGGQTAFEFEVRMPSGGDYYERLTLVAEGHSWFNDAGLTLYLHGKTYAWQPVWQSLSTGNPNIPRNTEFTVTVRVKNTGEMTWNKGGSFPVRLGTAAPLNRGSAFYHSSWISDTRPAGLVENSVAHGAEGTFTFTARTPNTPGPRFERFSLVAEGMQWFNDPGFQIYINVL